MPTKSLHIALCFYRFANATDTAGYWGDIVQGMLSMGELPEGYCLGYNVPMGDFGLRGYYPEGY